MLTLDLINTVAFGGVVLFLGLGVRSVLPVLGRYNVPAPVIGGLLVALVMHVARWPRRVDRDLRHQAAGAVHDCVLHDRRVRRQRVALESRRPQVLMFLLIATVFAVLQNVVGIVIAIPMGMHPLFGVLNGSVTLTGGPATGLAFAPAFERHGVPGAATAAIAAAMVGVSGGLIGGPLGTILIERNGLRGGGRAVTIRRSPLRSSRISCASRPNRRHRTVKTGSLTRC